MKLITAEQAAEMLSVSVQRAYEMARTGILPRGVTSPAGSSDSFRAGASGAMGFGWWPGAYLVAGVGDPKPPHRVRRFCLRVVDSLGNADH